MKRTKTALVLALVGLGLVLPATASGDNLSMSHARSRALDVVLDWSLADPNISTFWVNSCWRYSPHKTSCDANLESTQFGDLHCGISRCWSTDTIRICWKRVYARLSPHWQAFKVRYSVGPSHCSTRTDTDYY
jgi:hypothetical protein